MQPIVGSVATNRRNRIENLDVNRYIAIKTTVSMVTGILATTLLWLMGVDFPILWGLLAFLLNYVPNIGSFIAAIPPVLLALACLVVAASAQVASTAR